MRSVYVCICLALLLPWFVQSQRSSAALAKLDEDTQMDVLAVDILNRSGVLNSLLQSEHHRVLRRARAPRPASQVPKRAQQGSRFALSLDVPTSILSVLIDLAKNQDMRTKAAANAELMARIGKRKWKASGGSLRIWWRKPRSFASELTHCGSGFWLETMLVWVKTVNMCSVELSFTF